jgi:signal transduction histidine kinase
VIKPVVELSGVAADVASGKPQRALTRGGPVEIEILSLQIGRIADYLAERHRIEDELRNKIATLQQRLQKIHMDLRQRSVLLAGLLGEYKNSLRNINGFAQVLKDQLYGPIENKKYRQYAADIHQAGTTLELMVRKLIALTRVDSAALLMRDEEMPLAALIAGARRFAQETITGATLLPIHNEVQEQQLRLRADGMQTQQGLSYLMLYLLAQTGGEGGITCLLRTVPQAKADDMLVLLIGAGDATLLSDAIITEALHNAALPPALPVDETVMDQLHYTLGQGMLALQQIDVAIVPADIGAGNWIAVRLPAGRLMKTAE